MMQEIIDEKTCDNEESRMKTYCRAHGVLDLLGITRDYAPELFAMYRSAVVDDDTSLSTRITMFCNAIFYNWPEMAAYVSENVDFCHLADVIVHYDSTPTGYGPSF